MKKVYDNDADDLMPKLSVAKASSPTAMTNRPFRKPSTKAPAKPKAYVNQPWGSVLNQNKK